MADRNVDELLKKWGQVTVNNTEQGVLRAFYLSAAGSTVTVDKFSTWLLAGTGATGAILISQINSVLPYLSVKGFKVCMGLLIISALCGFVAKYKAITCEIGLRALEKMMQLFEPIIKEHEETEEKILGQAKIHNLDIEIEIDLASVKDEFVTSLSWLPRFFVKKSINKQQQKKGQHVELVVMVNHFMSQAYWTYFQLGFFILFMLAGAWYASDI